MLNTEITSINLNFDTSLSYDNFDYSNDTQNSEFSSGLDTSNFPYFRKEFDFLSKKKIRKSSLDEELIEQGIKKVFLEEKEKENDETKRN